MIATLLALVVPVLAGTAEERNIVARAGTTDITQRDISYRLGVEKAYGNKKITAATALVSLVIDAIEHEVACAHEVDVTQEEIAAFKKYVDENSKAPEILAKVKKVFKGDITAYERIYLTPKIVNRKLHYFYSRDPEIHKSERAQIEKAYG